MDTSVAEIHGHPLRPPGFAEPLFLGSAAKKEIAEHLRDSSGWLRRAAEVQPDASERAEEVCHVLRRPDGGGAYLVRAGRSVTGPACRRRRTSKRRVVRVVERWREVRGWWQPGGGADRFVFRVMLRGGAVVDLALDCSGERAGSWSLLRVLD